VEAEFISVCTGVQGALWFAKLIYDFGENPGRMVIYTDNTGALANFESVRLWAGVFPAW
jgi:hypothetical protein